MKRLSNANDKLEILTRLSHLKEDNQARWGKMNANQMLCHLSDAFKSVMGERMFEAKHRLVQQTLMKWLALYVPVPWPKGQIKTMPEIDQEIAGTKPTYFLKDKEELVRLIERFSAQDKDFVLRAHSLMGTLTEQEWQRWAYLHIDHHLRQFLA